MSATLWVYKVRRHFNGHTDGLFRLTDRTGLLPLLSSIQKYAHVRDFAGQRLGVDAYGWLHRGTFACATELAQDKPCRAYVDFALSRVRMLLHYGVTPYLVFDGGRLPSKAQTERERSERRKEGRRRGIAYLEAGKPTLAYQELQKSIDVTPQMARNLIEELKTAGVDYVVAPYEADSQLAYLEHQGEIAGILSEDSDLLVFGAQVLITKLDQYGECVVYRRSDFTKCKEVSLVNWSSDEFRMMAILSGCDYLPGIPGIGLKSAYRLVRQHKSIEKIIRMLQFDGKKKVPGNYLESFQAADRTFLHQWVFCPHAKRLVNLTPLPRGLFASSMPYIGAETPADLSAGVAAGDLHPSSKQPLRSTLQTSSSRIAQTAVQKTPDIKEGRPISEFFKPVRTPLAELDPNSFTPSPSQQQLLQSQGTPTWSVRTATSGRAGTDPLRSAIQAATSRSSSIGNATKVVKPAKQRLCADKVTSTEEEFRSVVESPYFAPTLTGQPKARKKAHTFDVFSDDLGCASPAPGAKPSEGELTVSPKALTDRSPKKRKRFEVFADAGERRRSLHMSTAPDTQAIRSVSLSSLSQSQGSALSCASDTSLSSVSTNEGLLDLQQLHERSSKQRLYDLKVPTKAPFFRQKLELQNTSCTEQGESVEPNTTSPRQDGPDSQQQAAADKSVRCPPPDELAPCETPSPEEFDDSEVKTSCVQQAFRDATARREQRCELMGSEDHLIPHSPRSDDEDGRLRPKLDLTGFAFAQ